MPGLPTIKEMASALIAAPSISSTLPQFDMGNRGVIDILAGYLDGLGFDVTITPLPGKDDKANLIAHFGSGTGGLVLSGHTDTVPMDEDLWASNPFTLTERDDRWYGLGACDMKGFFALALAAVEPLLAEGLKRPLTIVATADEESTMSGARALTAAELAGARFALIGEPTELKPVNRHKGIIMLRASLKGASGHSSDPDLGVNALDESATLVQALINYRDDLARRYRDESFRVSRPTMNLGCIHGGDNPNRICDHLDLSFDMRILPGMDSESLIGELDERLTRTFSNAAVDFDLALLNPYVPPFSNDDPEVFNLLKTFTSEPAGPVAFATEAPFLKSLGLQTTVLGPGSIDQAHQPDEFLALSQIDPAIDIIRGLTQRVCLKP